MALDLIVFEEARKTFFDLERQAFSAKNSQLVLPDSAKPHFMAAGFAYSLVISLGYGQLRELSRKGIVRGTLISNSSLSTTLSIMRRYASGNATSFTRDEYEQLGRTCEAAKTLCEKGLLY